MHNLLWRQNEPKRGWRGRDTDPKFVQDQVDAIEEETRNGVLTVLIPARQLIERLGYLYGLHNVISEKVLFSQYNLAKTV